MIVLDTGSKSAADLERDTQQFAFNPNHPNQSPARTTFYEKDAPATKREKFARLWKLQHGRGHTWEGWHGHRVRQEDVFSYRRARAILSQADVPKLYRESVARQVVREDLQGFSRYYAGMDGATLGFAALREFDSLRSAKASRLSGFASEELDIDGAKLMEYVWRACG